MGFGQKINNIRRKIMASITKDVGTSQSIRKLAKGESLKVHKILVIRPNHRLGNQLLLTPLIQELEYIFPGASIDIFAKGGVAYPIFEKYDKVSKIYKLPRKPFSNILQYIWCWFSIKGRRYDLVVNGDKNSSSGRLLTKFSRGNYKIFGDVHDVIVRDHPDHLHISKYPIYNLRWFLNEIGFDYRKQDIPTLNIKLTQEELANGNRILMDLVDDNKNTMCIYTNATGDKCYSEDWWESFYQKLLTEYGNEYHIIEMLPVENISKINFKAPHFYSKDIREMAAIIANTSIFIAADNGVMHLASASQTPVLGFFKTTSIDVYGPYGNGSIAYDTKETTTQDWLAAISKIIKS